MKYLILIAIVAIVCIALGLYVNYGKIKFLIMNYLYFRNKPSVFEHKEKFEKELLKGNKIEYGNTYPNIIWQTYHTKSKIPNEIFTNIQMYAPGYKHFIMDDQDAISFLETYFTKKVKDTFIRLKLGAHKADLLRYALLYIYGGIYLDIKTELIEPISKSFPNKDQMYVFLNSEHVGWIYQGIIVSPKGNPFFLSTIEFMTRNLNPYYYHLYCLDFWHTLRLDIGRIPTYGYNVGKINKYYICREHSTSNSEECYDGLDRYGLCGWGVDVRQKWRKFIKIRRSNYPF